MNIDKLFKKRVVFFITSTVFILCVTVASSYAFAKSDLNSDAVVMNNNNLSVLYEQEQVIDNKTYPMSYQESSDIPTSKIKVINNKKFAINYVLKISNKDEDANNLEFDKIYYSINDNDPMLLSSAVDGYVYYSKIDGYDEVELNIKVWASSEYVTNDDQGKSVNLKFEIIEN